MRGVQVQGGEAFSPPFLLPFPSCLPFSFGEEKRTQSEKCGRRGGRLSACGWKTIRKAPCGWPACSRWGQGGTETCSLSALGRGRGNGQFVCVVIRPDGNGQPVRAGFRAAASECVTYAAGSTRPRRGHGERKESVCPCCEHKKRKRAACLRRGQGARKRPARPCRGQGGGNCQSVCVVVSPNGSGQSVRAGFRSNGNGQPVCAAVKVGRKRSARPRRSQGVKTLC